MRNDPQLKPCPFCPNPSGPLRYTKQGYVMCPTCRNWMHTAEQWNTRAEPAVDLEPVARAICRGCGENPDHQGDCRGNDCRWEDYTTIARLAIKAMFEVTGGQDDG